MLEWLQTTFDGMQNLTKFEQLFDGQVQLVVLNQMEPSFWVQTQGRPMSGSSPDRRKSVGLKPLGTLISRADKVKNF